MNDAVGSAITLTDRQRAVLDWIRDGCPDGIYSPEDSGHKSSARALHRRGLIRISGHGPTWTAVPTERGTVWPGAVEDDLAKVERESEARRKRADEKRAAITTKAPVGRASGSQREASLDAALVPRVTRRQSAGSKEGKRPAKRAPDPKCQVISPAEARRRGGWPRGDRLTGGVADPWDEKIMVTVKEAAWMLSLPEGSIREAIRDGDLQRVFIGSGTTRYRIVYGSLLAWVDSMPSEPGVPKLWWR